MDKAGLKNLFRYAIERYLAGVKDIVPLDPTEFAKGLGPGYRRGWYAWKNLGERVDNCEIKKINKSHLDDIQENYWKINEMLNLTSYELFCNYLESDYHTKGHNTISELCSPGSKIGHMAFSEVSARDPIFYRWHTHLEEINKKFKARVYPG